MSCPLSPAFFSLEGGCGSCPRFPLFPTSPFLLFFPSFHRYTLTVYPNSLSLLLPLSHTSSSSLSLLLPFPLTPSLSLFFLSLSLFVLSLSLPHSLSHSSSSLSHSSSSLTLVSCVVALEAEIKPDETLGIVPMPGWLLDEGRVGWGRVE